MVDITPNKRRDFLDLTDDEITRLAGALNQLADRGKFDEWSQLHADISSNIHGGQAFLPWHRWFLLEIEDLIQIIEPDLFIPYWDWTKQGSQGLENPKFKSFFGDRTLPISDNGGLLNSSSWRYDRDATPDSRYTLPTLPEVYSLYSEKTYEEFSSRIEGIIHGVVHMWVGGTMGTMASPIDPLFFIHHCNIDRLWAVWQMNNRSATQYSGPGPNNSNYVSVDGLMSLSNKTTPREMINHKQFNVYDEDKELKSYASKNGNKDFVAGG